MKSQQPSNNRENLIVNLTNQLSSQWTLSNNGNLIVNGQPVLVRTTTAQNTHVCIELYHEDNQARWVKSWGISTPNRFMVLLMEDAVYWYDVTKLQTLASEGIINGTYQLVNNSNKTRSNNRPSSNVMNVWVPLLNKALLTTGISVNLDKYIKE